MSDLLEIARKSLPGLAWRRWDDGGVRAILSDGMPISLYCQDGYCVVLLGAFPRSTFDTIDAALMWLVSRLTFRRDALTAALGEGWIPVGERLPELRNPVLAWDGENVFITMLLPDVWLSFGPSRYLGVTHWMPLPAPPNACIAQAKGE